MSTNVPEDLENVPEVDKSARLARVEGVVTQDKENGRAYLERNLDGDIVETYDPDSGKFVLNGSLEELREEVRDIGHATMIERWQFANETAFGDVVYTVDLDASRPPRDEGLDAPSVDKEFDSLVEEYGLPMDLEGSARFELETANEDELIVEVDEMGEFMKYLNAGCDFKVQQEMSYDGSKDAVVTADVKLGEEWEKQYED